MFRVQYLFVSSKAYGEDYAITVDIKARDAKSALTIAGIEGFSRFGARFTENCIDWRIAN